MSRLDCVNGGAHAVTPKAIRDVGQACRIDLLDVVALELLRCRCHGG